MDINQTRKGESAPTPNNTPRNAAPIQNQPKGQQQQQNQGGKQKGQGNQQQQQQQQNQQQQKGQGSQQQNQQQQNQQQNQGGKQKGQGNQQQNQPQQQQQQKGQGSQQQNQPQQQQKGQQQQQQQSQPQQQQQGQQGGKKNKGGNNNAVVKVEEESQPTFKVELPGGGDLSQNPFLASLLESKLSSMLGHSSGYVESLSPEVQRRVKALKNVQDSHAKLEADFREEVLALEAKYLALKKPLYQKRKSIVNGNVEPTDEECEREDSDMEDDFANRLTIEDEEEEEEEEEPEEEKSGKKAGKKGQQQQQQVAKPKGKKEKPKVKGIPEFWLTTIKNHPLIGETIMEYDDAVLVHLIDVTLSYAEDNHSFSIEFEFEDNEYFTNKTLTKTYFLQNNVDSAYDDLVYSKAEGCKIDWKQDKDVTVRVETKKQKNKASKKIRVVKTLVPQDSFFRFFSPPEAPGHKGGDDDEEEEGEEDDEFISPELEDEIERDFEFGEVFKTKLIPDAIHWFTGQALQYEDDYMEDEEDYDEEDEEEEEEDEDDDDDEEEDDNDDDDGARGHARGGRGGAGAGARGGARGGKGMGAGAQKAGEKPAECNQQ